MSGETYRLEVTGEQARILASWLSLVAQDVQQSGDEVPGELAQLAEVGQQCAAIADDAGEWDD